MGGEWVEFSEYPYISGVGSARVYEIFLTGQALGNRGNIFAKVGDSITRDARFLTPIDEGRYNLHEEYGYLEAVIKHFSFANESVAAVNGWKAESVLYGSPQIKGVCRRGEAPLACEYRVSRPAIAVIMLGTNDAASGTSLASYEKSMREVVEISAGYGVIPILTTIPPINRKTSFSVARYNQVIWRVVAEFEVPLIDYWAALQELPGYGLSSDGVHPWAPYSGAADFSLKNLTTAGITVRNLLTLQALDEVWHFIQAEADCANSIIAWATL